MSRHGAGDSASVGVAILTVSDTRTPETDQSGALVADLCRAAGHTVAERSIVPDDPDRVAAAVEGLLSRDDVEAVLVNGGTGISGRDRTHEAIASLLEKRLDGFGELFRHLSFQQIGPAAMLSRAVAGVAARRPIFSIPGSTAAVRLAMERLILPTLGHLVAEARRDT